MVSNITLSVANIVASTSVDGPGLRSSLYLQGCNLHCPGCQNAKLWNIDEGKQMTLQEVFDQLLEADENISILGGEPLMQYHSVVELCRKIKSETDKNIWLYSGYEVEAIKKHFPDILGYIDVLVDGPFVKKLADTTLLFRGSSNQNIIAFSEVGKGILDKYL